ncbi:hypothetical protein AB0I93_26655 [Streptomyces sp. NPDC049967]|uniref:hypothetical protein n=1 Tax=Streptomyces sp. NPDC049967 TaxID=3155658 RepID=UPI003426FAA2
MTSSARPQEVAAAMRRRMMQAASAEPTVRRADWRGAVVASVGTDGTITTTDGIVARRRATYLSPVVGEQIMITVSGSGSWIADGRTAPATTAGTWVPLTYSGSWAAWGSTYNNPAYRVNGDGTASLCGFARAPASTTSSSTIATLPVEARPATKIRYLTQLATGVHGTLDIFPTGVIQINDFTGTATWAALDVASGYRLY